MWSEEGEYLSGLGPDNQPVSEVPLSKVQFEGVQDRAKNGWMPDDEEDRGIVCPKGCGTRIRGSLADIQAHNDEHHPGE
jgi:hypothetical protein